MGKTDLNDDLSSVVDANVHALTARFPRPRYLVGPDARYIIIFIPITAQCNILTDFALFLE